MRYYVALLHKDDESDFGVSFPDFPGRVSAGSTLAEAAAMAAVALDGHERLGMNRSGFLVRAAKREMEPV